jgi:hypothetical protein
MSREDTVMNLKAIILAASLLTCANAARADEFAIKLKPDAGADLAQSNCSACHSLDYIITNSPFMSATVWDAEVKKMVNVFGASIKADDAKAITNYLVKNYGG